MFRRNDYIHNDLRRAPFTAWLRNIQLDLDLKFTGGAGTGCLTNIIATK